MREGGRGIGSYSIKGAGRDHKMRVKDGGVMSHLSNDCACLTRDREKRIGSYSGVQEEAMRLVFQIRVRDNGGMHLPTECAS